MAGLYLDSSAIVKLVLPEPSAGELDAFLKDRHELATSGLALTEVPRAVYRANPGALAVVDIVLRRFQLLPVTDEILRAAAALQPATLRSLDAIHLASAMLLEPELEAIVSYDARMLEGAHALGLPVTSPA